MQPEALLKVHKTKRIKDVLDKLAKPGILADRLNDLDSVKPLERFYVMGCGRSGTWLLTSLFTTFKDVSVVPKEVPVEYFGLMEAATPILVLKRNYKSYQHIDLIPDSIKIVWIVRHPFDVLTSHNPVTKDEYHIQPWRWYGEMCSLKYLVDTQRPNTLVVRYEDLASDPESVQVGIADKFDLAIGTNVGQVQSSFQASPEAEMAMHGLRPIDTESISKFRKDPGKIEYLRSIVPRLGGVLDWVASEYSYDLSLD